MHRVHRELPRLTATTGLIKVVAAHCNTSHWIMSNRSVWTDVPSAWTTTFGMLSFVSHFNLDLKPPVENYTLTKTQSLTTLLHFPSKTKKSNQKLKGGIVQTFVTKRRPVRPRPPAQRLPSFENISRVEGYATRHKIRYQILFVSAGSGG